MGDVIADARRLKESAKTNRDFGDFDDALEDMEKAIALLEEELVKAGASSPDKETTVRRRQEIAAELADCYGMAGGLYRRKKDLDLSVGMYAKGRDYEQAPEHNLSDSYNLTNFLTVSLLAAPQSLIALRPQIAAAAAAVEKQVEEKRREQWWAWADLGVLSLLGGNPARAEEAYDRFKEKGALARHFKSSIEVLEELRVALEPVEPGVSAAISTMVARLHQNMPAR